MRPAIKLWLSDVLSYQSRSISLDLLAFQGLLEQEEACILRHAIIDGRYNLLIKVQPSPLTMLWIYSPISIHYISTLKSILPLHNAAPKRDTECARGTR